MTQIEIKNKTYHVPESPDEITLGQWDRVQVYKLNRIELNPELKHTIDYRMATDIFEILCGIPADYQRMEAPMQFFELLLEKMEWIFTLDFDEYPLSDRITIDNQDYVFSFDRNVPLQEWVDGGEILKSYPDTEKNPAYLAIRLRKEIRNDILDASGNTIDVKIEFEPYTSEFLAERTELFKNIPASKAIPIINFFKASGLKYQRLTKVFLTGLDNALLQHRELLRWLNNGDGTQPLANSLKTIYGRSILSYSSKLSKCLTFSHSLSTKEMPTTKTRNSTNDKQEQKQDSNQTK